MTRVANASCRHVVAYVGLGSNVGDRLASLRSAVGRLASLSDRVRTSGVYEARYVGPAAAEQPAFLNAVAECAVVVSPEQMLAALLEIERGAGRSEVDRSGPRTLDLDLLLFGDVERSGPRLTLPHPRMWERAFVLAPLAELAPSLTSPNGEPIRVIADRLASEQAPFVRTRQRLPFGR